MVVLAPAAAASPALGIDISGYDADEIITFVRGLGDLGNILPEDRVALFEKLKKRFDALAPTEKFKLMKAAMDAYNANKLDPVAVNGRELMKAYQHVMLVEYFKADPEKRKKILDERIDEQQAMESMRKLADVAKMFGKTANQSPEDRMAMMRQHIGDAIQDSLRNGAPEDRAMMTHFMLDMRQRRQDRGLKVLF